MEIVQRQTIMIVDDMPVNLEILTEILSPDYVIKAVKTGRKALEIANIYPQPDLILLDVLMPDLNGFETCRLLKEDPLTMAIPVIFVSSQSEGIDEAMGFTVGGVDYITKPVSPLIVRARVKTHLALSVANRELMRQNKILQENVLLLERIEQIARHDLKSPLTIFMGASEYMNMDNNLNSQQLEFLKILDESALKMLNMIDQSLDLAKMEKGQYKLKLCPVDIVKLVRLVCWELESLAKARNITCRIFLNGKHADDVSSSVVQGEQLLLATIVANLMKNAIEASPDGGEVLISLFELDPFKIEISNKGCIPAEIKSRFLEQYATFGKQKGTGLGGYSARLMARTLGGDIQFVSTEETGTVITVSIPCLLRILKKSPTNALSEQHLD